MEIIASHNNTDLDGLASMVAAKKLYPEAQMVFVGTLSPQCEEFMALHRDIFNVQRAGDIPFEQVTKLILVDTKEYKRIGSLQRLIKSYDIEVHIFDHHPRSDDDIPAHLAIIENVGATTTLLVELIMERCIPLSSFDATVLALGIYSDTGNLTFSSTHSRDAGAVAFLLSQGARLSIISDFTANALTEVQKSLFNSLILSAQHYLLNGVKILLAKASIDEFVAGLGLLTHKLGDIEGVDLIFAVVFMQDRVHLVARSRVDNVNVKAILQELGGGGHEKAASATIKAYNLDEVVTRLVSICKEQIKPAVTAGQIMSSPVKTVYPTTTIEEAGKIMLRYGHSGLPVVEGLKMVGVISRRDVDKALNHQLGHAPVKGYMNRNIVSTSIEASLTEIQQLLIKNNIGRLPVLKGGRLVGIVSRTDILKTLHGESYPQSNKKKLNQCSMANLESANHLLKKLPPNLKNLLEQISYLAEIGNWKVYIVGGFVRDLLLGVKNLDFDLVVEGDGIAFAKELAKYLGCRTVIHEKFATAVVILPDGFKLDVATARVEYYEYPAALPEVETSSLQQDIYRRDFTINAMAISLMKNSFGKIIDYFCGRADLEGGIIRILYNLSFVDDPTRLLRAIRFEQRYNFTIEHQTLELAKQAIKDNWLSKLSQERLREEIKHIFDEAYPINAIYRMQEFGLWKYIIPEIEVDKHTTGIIVRLHSINADLIKDLSDGVDFNPWLTYLIALIHKLEPTEVEKVAQRLKLTREEQRKILIILKETPKVLKILTSQEYLNRSLIYKALEGLPIEAAAFLLAQSYSLRVIERIKLYFELNKELKLSISGDDLVKLGIPPGPTYRDILEALKEAKLDGKLKTREDELEFALKFTNTKEGK